MSDWKPTKKEPEPKAEVPKDKPITYNEPARKKKITTTTTTKTTKTRKKPKKNPKKDPKLERLKDKYNRHLEDEPKEEPIVSEPKEVDYSEMSPREIQDLIDDALDNGDFETVEKLHKYI